MIAQQSVGERARLHALVVQLLTLLCQNVQRRGALWMNCGNRASLSRTT
jgi:hypothetical protein